jgi:hypothetical protein
MNGGNGALVVIIDKNRDAVSCLYGKAKTWNVGKYSICVVGTSKGSDLHDMVRMRLTRKGQRSANSIGTGFIKLFTPTCRTGT